MTLQMAGRASTDRGSKPSLYADPSVALHSATVQADSILGGLEHYRPRRKRLIGVLGIAMAGAIAIGWWQAGGGVSEKDDVPVVFAEAPHASVPVAAAMPPKEQIAQSGKGEAAGTSHDDDEQTPAVVISVSENAEGMSSAIPLEVSVGKPAPSVQVADGGDKGSGQGTNAATTTAQIPIPAATVSAGAPALAQETKAKPVQSAGLLNTEKQKAPQVADGQTAMKSPTTAKGKDGATDTAKSSGAGEAKTKHHAGKDGDVELIAALLNRVSARSEPATEDASRKPVAGRGTSRLPSGDQKKMKKAGVTRESVSPNPVTAENQLKQCGSMGVFEGELCRFRVCDGRWGRDPACPEYLHTSAALP